MDETTIPGDVTGYADGDCKSPVSGSTPDFASETLEMIEDNRQHPERGKPRPRRFGFIQDGPDDGPTPYCLDCVRYLCRRRPGMENHRIVRQGDPEYPRK